MFHPIPTPDIITPVLKYIDWLPIPQHVHLEHLMLTFKANFNEEPSCNLNVYSKRYPVAHRTLTSAIQDQAQNIRRQSFYQSSLLHLKVRAIFLLKLSLKKQLFKCIIKFNLSFLILCFSIFTKAYIRL